MFEKRVPLQLPSGFFKNGTPQQARDRWADGNFIRFLDGTIRAIGGWRRMDNGTGTPVAALSGKPRGIYAFRDSLNALRLTIGTHTKAYNITSGVLSDITPAGLVAGTQDGASVIGTTPTAYGAGAYGAGPYGGGVYSDSEFTAPDTWQFDSFGDILLGVLTSDGTLYESPDSTTQMVATTGDANLPTDAIAVVVTPERFVVLLCPGRRVVWSDQEDRSVYVPSATNQAGDFILSTEGKLVCGRRTRRATLLFTTTDVWTMTFIGGTLVYAFDKAGDQCGIIGPNAVATAGSRAFWMGRNNFFVFDGWVQPIPSEVRDFVFSDINLVQAAKITCATNGDYDEVTWFYPSQTSLENDRYVTFNYRENHWVTGTLDRAAILDRGASTYPVWVDSSGQVWEHEVGDYHDSAPYLVSGPVMLEQGDRVLRIQKLVPDEKNQGEVAFEIAAFFAPWDQLQSYTYRGPYSTTRETDVRLTGRYFLLRFTEQNPGWRIGTMVMGLRPQGRR